MDSVELEALALQSPLYGYTTEEMTTSQNLDRGLLAL
ncbi:hypothetical protein PIIN_10047 [Serendipita indica DSM 11827]|uniref:Uncharacterized protein n=1 Tax=Serendipita indica (strain DSM 11827) TaxID=1109443 RepID=G4TXK4_SERID|nr:hypothetical protein PIIN_10047 [Serendipita indica DSM 11827]